MSIAVVNRLGFFMALAAFGLAYALRLQWPSLSDAILLAFVAGMFVALDILWRIGKGKRKWFRPASGGSIFTCRCGSWASRGLACASTRCTSSRSPHWREPRRR